MAYTQSTRQDTFRVSVPHSTAVLHSQLTYASVIQYCKSVRAEAAAAQSELRKATANATSLAAARAVADEKARKQARARGGRCADRLAPPKSD